VDCDSVYVEEDKYLSLDDPFLSYAEQADQFIEECGGPGF
jgi:hypothetical protein